jgi:hypothetical protein
MQTFVERHYRSLLLLIWVVGCLILVVTSRTAIAEWRMGDPDDQLRLVQVRDWLAGQSWWDITQYRMNLPEGGQMHWSRLVDVPIAAAILLLKPIIGLELAEHVAVVIIPLLTFGIVLCLYTATARRLFGTVTAVVAAFLFITIMPAVTQVRPMRIDHHGWQLVLFFIASVNLFDPRSPVRAAAIIGAALALWIEISVEGLPFAIIILGILGLRWLCAGNDPARKADNYALPTALLSLVLASALCFSVTEGWSGISNYCDSLSPFHLVIFFFIAAAVAVGTLIKLRVAGRVQIAAAVLTIVLAGSGGIMLALNLAPQCAGDAFSQLDPLVREFWFNRGPEGLPLWSVQLQFAIQQIAGLVAGSVALAYLTVVSGKLTVWDKLALALLFIGSAVVGSFVSRTTVYALCVGTIMLSAMLVDAFAKVEQLKGVAARMGLRTVVMLLAMPSLVGLNIMNRIDAADDFANPASKIANDRFIVAASACQKLSAAKALTRLPQSNLMVGVDTAPAILQMTNHSVIATGHHRNQSAMSDVIRTFTGPVEQAERIINLRRAQYLVICDGSFELAIYAKQFPHGFLAGLRRGRVPAWLDREADIGPFQVFRVDPKNLSRKLREAS